MLLLYAQSQQCCLFEVYEFCAHFMFMSGATSISLLQDLLFYTEVSYCLITFAVDNLIIFRQWYHHYPTHILISIFQRLKAWTQQETYPNYFCTFYYLRLRQSSTIVLLFSQRSLRLRMSSIWLHFITYGSNKTDLF